MYTIPKDERYFVLDRYNRFFQFDNYDELLNWFKTSYYLRYNPWCREFAQRGLDKVDKVGHHWNENCEYIVLDSMNRIINARILIADVKELEKHEDEQARHNRRRRFRINRNWLGFRNGPVPHTGYGNRAAGYRRMRTTQELRRNSWEREYARPKRTKKYLPNHWDDHCRGRRDNRCWKSQKKRKQWM